MIDALIAQPGVSSAESFAALLELFRWVGRYFPR